MKRAGFFFSLFILLVGLFFTACPTQVALNPMVMFSQAYGTIEGSIGVAFEGAYPDSFAAYSKSLSAGLKTAFPVEPNYTTCYYQMVFHPYALPQSNTADDIVTQKNLLPNDRKFLEKIPLGKWNITANLYVSNSSSVPIMTGTIENVELTENNPYKSNINFSLKPAVTSTGTGFVNLKISKDSAVSGKISKVKTVIYKDGVKISDTVEMTFGALDYVRFYLSDSATPVPVNSGVYTVDFKFYSSDNLMVYFCTEILNVFNNLTTDTWVKNGQEEFLTDDGSGNISFIVNQTCLDHFAMTTMYVDVRYANHGDSYGTYFAPYTTVEEALNKIQGATHSTAESDTYRVYVHAGDCESPMGRLVIGQAGSKIRKVVLEAYTDTPGDKTGHYTMNLTTSETIGLLVDEGSSLTATGIIFTGVSMGCSTALIKISKNSDLKLYDSKINANIGGPGIVITGGSCTANDSSIINNKCGVIIQAVDGVRGTFTMNGGIISENTSADCGAGVYVEENCTFVLNNGDVSSNRAITSGGGVYLKGQGSELIMNGGSINENCIGYLWENIDGAGIYVGAKASVTFANSARVSSDNQIYVSYDETDLSQSPIVFDSSYSSNNIIGRVEIENKASEGGTFIIPDDFVLLGNKTAGDTKVAKYYDYFDIVNKYENAYVAIKSDGKISVIKKTSLTGSGIAGYNYSGLIGSNALVITGSCTNEQLSTLMTKLNSASATLKVTLDLRGTSITTLTDFTFSNRIKEVYLPSTIAQITHGDGTRNGTFDNNKITAFHVPAGSTYMKTEEGVLFSRTSTSEGWRLSAYPGGKTDTKYVVPEFCKYVNQGAFFGNDVLIEIDGRSLPNGDTGAFRNMTKLETINIENLKVSTTSEGFMLPPKMFYDCEKLNTVTLSDEINVIKDSFRGCKALVSPPFPANLQKIDSQAFYGCNSINRLVIPEGVTSIGSQAFQTCSTMTSVTLPSTLTVLGSSAFSGCSFMNTINLPENLESIGATCFSNCYNLVSITIPASVTELGFACFTGCSKLDTITVVATTPPVVGTKNGTTSLGTSMTRLTTIKVPAGSVDAYKEAAGWSLYADRIVGM